MIKLGIAEDNTTFRDTLVEALELRSGIEIAFAARNGKDALHRTMQLNQPPEVILMDIDMPQLNGIEATRRLTSIAPQTKVIMLSIFDQEDQIFEAILSGASGYLLKGESPDEIVRAIHDVLAGRLPMSPVIAAKALGLIKQQTISGSSPEQYNLTSRETEILQLLADAKSYREIGEMLFISEKTVRNHIHNIYSKLQVSSRAEAMKLVHQESWFA